MKLKSIVSELDYLTLDIKAINFYTRQCKDIASADKLTNKEKLEKIDSILSDISDITTKYID